MAKVNEAGITGTIGNLVYYTMNGKNYVRTRPGKRKKRKGQAPRDNGFGIVSKYGTPMIKNISGSFLFRFGPGTYNAARGWMANQYRQHGAETTWNPSVKPNNLCRLNTETDIRDFMDIDLTVTDEGGGKLSVTIPALNPQRELKAPPRTIGVNMKLLASTAVFGISPFPFHFCMEQYAFDYSNMAIPGKTVLLDTKAAVGEVVIVAMALEFQVAGAATGYNTNTQWLPAAIIAMGRLG